uniref:Uncharacterized protein n=1 Tax=Leersia perrieri TaxID=77586 RepID=A0A0D9XUP2_9ORYZ
MAAKFSSVVLGVLIFVAIAATLCSAGLTEFGPTYQFCYLKCVDDCDPNLQRCRLPPWRRL